MRTPFLIGLSAALAGLAGCGAGDLTLPSDGSPARLIPVSGDGQEGNTGARLPDPVVVKVTDAKGRPVEGAAVAFSFDGDVSGGNLTPETGTSDSLGRVSASVRLGSTEGAQVVQARLGDGGAGLEARFQFTATRPDNGSGGGSGGGQGGDGNGGDHGGGGGGSAGGGHNDGGGGDQASGGSGGDSGGGGGDSSHDGSDGGSNHDSHDHGSKNKDGGGSHGGDHK
jgi:hypothetical protein